MKRLLLFVAIAMTSLAQGQTFNDVYIGGSLEKVISQFKAKGYTYKMKLEVGALMEGKFNFEEVELYILVTPKTKQVFKVAAYFSEATGWTSLKDSYFRYKEALTNKYGQPDYEEEKFITPYYDGDGYELSAVKNEKASYSSAWIGKGNLNIAVEISKTGQLKLIYENRSAMELKRREQEELQMRNL